MRMSDWSSDVCSSDLIIWTLVPVIILVLIAIPSFGLLQAQYKPAPANAITLRAIGNQWFWSYEHPDNGDLQLTADILKEQNQVPASSAERSVGQECVSTCRIWCAPST